MKVYLPFIPEATATTRREPALLRRPATKRTLQTDSLSEAKQVYASNKGQDNAEDVNKMPSPAKKQAVIAVISPTPSSKEEKTEKLDEDTVLSPQALFSQHLVQSPDGVDPVLSSFNAIDSDLLGKEVSAAKSITSSILAKGFPEGWLDETHSASNLFPDEFDLDVEFDLAAEFDLINPNVEYGLADEFDLDADIGNQDQELIKIYAANELIEQVASNDDEAEEIRDFLLDLFA